MVASHSTERAYDGHKQSGPTATVNHPTATIEFVKEAVLKRVAEYKASQVEDILVPLPPAFDPEIRPTTSSSHLSAVIDSRPYVASESNRNRTPVNFHSTVGARRFN